jgi:hypothetical protein
MNDCLSLRMIERGTFIFPQLGIRSDITEEGKSVDDTGNVDQASRARNRHHPTPDPPDTESNNP